MPGPSKRKAEPKLDENGKAERGRPGLLTPDLHAKIIEAVELLGMTENRAGAAYGVAETTISSWKARGRKAEVEWAKLSPKRQEIEKPYRDFIQAIRDADPKFEMANLLNIQQAAARGDWRASRDRLAMRFPERYGKRVLVGNDPRNPMPPPQAPTGIPTVLILPSNGREDPYLLPAAPEPAAKAKANGKTAKPSPGKAKASGMPAPEPAA